MIVTLTLLLNSHTTVAQPNPKNAIQTQRLYVGGLTATVTEAELLARFSPFGKVEDCQVIRDASSSATPSCRGFAYVALTAPEDKIKRCTALYNGSKWKGMQLKIEKAKETYMDVLKRRWDEEKESATDAPPAKKVRRKGPPPNTKHALDMALVTDKTIDKRKSWKHGRFGRAIAVMRMKKPGSNVVHTFDPTIYKTNIQKLVGTERPKDIANLTWRIDDEDERDVSDESESGSDGDDSDLDVLKDEDAKIEQGADVTASEPDAVHSPSKAPISSTLADAMDCAGSESPVDASADVAVNPTTIDSAEAEPVGSIPIDVLDVVDEKVPTPETETAEISILARLTRIPQLDGADDTDDEDGGENDGVSTYKRVTSQDKRRRKAEKKAAMQAERKMRAEKQAEAKALLKSRAEEEEIERQAELKRRKKRKAEEDAAAAEAEKKRAKAAKKAAKEAAKEAAKKVDEVPVSEPVEAKPRKKTAALSKEEKNEQRLAALRKRQEEGRAAHYAVVDTVTAALTGGTAVKPTHITFSDDDAEEEATPQRTEKISEAPVISNWVNKPVPQGDETTKRAYKVDTNIANVFKPGAQQSGGFTLSGDFEMEEEEDEYVAPRNDRFKEVPNNMPTPESRIRNFAGVSNAASAITETFTTMSTFFFYFKDDGRSANIAEIGPFKRTETAEEITEAWESNRRELTNEFKRKHKSGVRKRARFLKSAPGSTKVSSVA